jgi:hypothetical protein
LLLFKNQSVFIHFGCPYIAGMRVVGEIPHPELKITIFHWNNRYLIKLEAGPFEQTFKIEEYDISSEEEIKTVINEEFLRQSIVRFEDMAKSLRQATQFL